MSDAGLVQRGAWTAETAGGCPKYASWTTNPQFQIFPGTSSGNYVLTLRQEGSALHAVGLWVMRGDDTHSRKRTMTKQDMVGKSKFKQAERQSLSIALAAREDSLPYVVCCSTGRRGKRAPLNPTICLSTLSLQRRKENSSQKD